MSLTMQDVYHQADYLVIVASGLTIHIQDYDEEGGLTLEYDDGQHYMDISLDAPVEATVSGTLLILGTEYRAYVVQQVKFEPTKD